MRQSTQRTEMRQDRPCPVCKALAKCSIGTDGLIFCRGKHGPQPGFSYHGQAERDPQWALYRAASHADPAPHLHDPAPSEKLYGRKGNGEKPSTAYPWLQMAKDCQTELTAARKLELAHALGLPAFALDSLWMLGFHRDSRMGNVWTFPEMDGEEQLVGINRRTAAGKQQAMARARRGLTVCFAWEEREGPVYLVEGASDVLALAALGLTGIGRPSCRAGIDDLVALLGRLQAKRQIIVLGEWDQKESGEWPGRDGAVWVAEQLAARLGRETLWAMPPDRKKDVRAWCVLHPTPVEDRAYWSGLGERFAKALILNSVKPAATIAATDELDLRCYDQIEPSVMHWSIPGYFPRGELILLAGDGGEGKSLITLHIAACLTRGLPCFGLAYSAEAPAHVLLACCEDDASTTTKPRLMAAGADMGRVHEIQGITDDQGRKSPFGLGHIKQIQATLAKHAGIGLVVIDPVTAYLGTAGIDDGKDVEIRTLLEPLRVVIRQKGCLCLLVKHFNKTISPKASARIAGAAGWRNACRASYLVLPDPQLPTRKLFLPDKLNGAALPMGRIYRPTLPGSNETDAILASLPASWSAEDRLAFRHQLARVEWLGETDLDADSVCAEQATQRIDAGADDDRAAHWLRRYLGEGPLRGADVVQDGNENLQIVRELRWWRDRILKGRLGGTSAKGRGVNDAWYFCLPGQPTPGQAEETGPGIEESEESEETEESKNLRAGGG